MKHAAILTHPSSPEAPAVTRRLERLLGDAGVEVSHLACYDDGEEPPGSTDMVVAVGGDGTVLQAQRLAVPRELPVLGVAAGRLGFLAEIEPETLEESLGSVLEGRYRIERRCLVRVVQVRDGRDIGSYSALNDVVLARGRTPQSLWISVKIDGASLANYIADGVIAATATGSTAYSLAVGGPVLAPELPNILLTSIAAHLSFVQAIVLPAEARIELALLRAQESFLSVDGQVNVPVQYGDDLVVTSSDERAQFVRLGSPSRFYAQLVARLQYNLARTRVTS